MGLNGGLLNAKVFHKRFHPKVNAFAYQVYYACVPLSRIDKKTPLLSRNRFGLMSLEDRDHAARDGTPLEPWIRAALARFGVSAADGEIVLVTHPRTLGFVFNPVSFWFCLDHAGALRAVLAEVNNTFGDRHSYLLSHPDQRVIAPEDVLESVKAFHVSPFMQLEGGYQFRFHYSEKKIGVWIDYIVGGELWLATSVVGKRVEWTRGSALKAWALMPMVTLKTLALIHWQAIKIWLKGIAYVPRPLPPKEDITR